MGCPRVSMWRSLRRSSRSAWSSSGIATSTAPTSSRLSCWPWASGSTTSSGSGRPRTQAIYTLKGDVPAGVDVAAVEELLARRMNEKKTGDFDAADAIQAELNGMGVFVNDRKKTWEASK